VASHAHDSYAAYREFTRRKALITAGLFAATVVVAILAVGAGAADLSTADVVRALLRLDESVNTVIVWNVRLPRVLVGVVAGMALAVSGAVMQNVLRNPLASPFTLGVSQGAAFGAALAIIGLGAGATQNLTAGAVRVTSALPVAAFAFAGALVATAVIVAVARFRSAAPETVVLTGVALGSLFAALTVLLQYFAEDTQVAAVVFWTFGDLGRASWRDLAIMTAITATGLLYTMFRRWDYNALEAGAEAAEGLGVDVERVRLEGMLAASLMTAGAVAFLGIIGFIGLVGPHLVRRVLGNDYRFVLPASACAGALLLLVSDTVARTVISPVVLPVGAITSLLGAPLFLYLLVGRRGSR
jgi:iron complex transport system permease protein